MKRVGRAIDEFKEADKLESEADLLNFEASLDREDGISNLNAANKRNRSRSRSSIRSGGPSNERATDRNLKTAAKDFRKADRLEAGANILENRAAVKRSAGRRDMNKAGREFSKKFSPDTPRTSKRFKPNKMPRDFDQHPDFIRKSKSHSRRKTDHDDYKPRRLYDDY